MRSTRQSKAGTGQPRLRSARKIKPQPAGRAANKQSSGEILADLKQRLSEIYDLNAAGSVLGWDEATYMPTGGAVARGRQIAMLRRLAHERFVDPALGRLLDRLEPRADKLPADDASLLRVVRRDYEKSHQGTGRITSRGRMPMVRHPTMPGSGLGRRTTSLR